MQGDVSVHIHTNRVAKLELQVRRQQKLKWSAFTHGLTSGVSHYDKIGNERCSIVILENSSTFFSINDQDEAFDILMVSVEDQILFSVDGEEGKNLHTKVPEISEMVNE